MKRFFPSRFAFQVVIAVFVTTLVVVGIAMATTTLGTNISTDGTLTVTATSTLNGFSVLAPTRDTRVYAYGVDINTDTFFQGLAAQKSYLLSVRGDRTASYDASGDSNDALIKVAGNNYAQNDGNFIFRGVNSGINNRSGGLLGTLEGASIGAQNKSGGYTTTTRGLTVTPENYGTVSDEFGGIDIVMKNEGAVATTEYGLRVRNLNNSIADAVGAGILFSDTGANTGWDYLLDANGASVVAADIRLHNGETIDNLSDGSVKITSPALVQAYDAAAYWTATQADAGGVTFDSTSDGTASFTFSDPVIASGSYTSTTVLYVYPPRPASDYAYGLNVNSGDGFFTGGSAQKSYLAYFAGDRPSGSAATGDSNDSVVRVSFNNYAANDDNFIMRGYNGTINNRSGGMLGTLEGAQIGAQNKSGGYTTTTRGLTVVPENYGTVTGEFGGIDVVMKNEGAVATTEYGLRVRNLNNSIADAVGAGILFSDTGANTGFDYLFDGNGASVVVADLRLSNGETISNTTDGGIITSGWFQVGNGTIAATPTCNAANEGLFIVFTDAANATDCSTGSGSTRNMCYCGDGAWTDL